MEQSKSLLENQSFPKIFEWANLYQQEKNKRENRDYSCYIKSFNIEEKNPFVFKAKRGFFGRIFEKIVQVVQGMFGIVQSDQEKEVKRVVVFSESIQEGDIEKYLLSHSDRKIEEISSVLKNFLCYLEECGEENKSDLQAVEIKFEKMCESIASKKNISQVNVILPSLPESSLQPIDIPKQLEHYVKMTDSLLVRAEDVLQASEQVQGLVEKFEKILEELDDQYFSFVKQIGFLCVEKKISLNELDVLNNKARKKYEEIYEKVRVGGKECVAIALSQKNCRALNKMVQSISIGMLGVNDLDGEKAYTLIAVVKHVSFAALELKTMAEKKGGDDWKKTKELAEAIIQRSEQLEKRIESCVSIPGERLKFVKITAKNSPRITIVVRSKVGKIIRKRYAKSAQKAAQKFSTLAGNVVLTGMTGMMFGLTGGFSAAISSGLASATGVFAKELVSFIGEKAELPQYVTDALGAVAFASTTFYSNQYLSLYLQKKVEVLDTSKQQEQIAPQQRVTEASPSHQFGDHYSTLNPQKQQELLRGVQESQTAAVICAPQNAPPLPDVQVAVAQPAPLSADGGVVSRIKDTWNQFWSQAQVDYERGLERLKQHNANNQNFAFLGNGEQGALGVEGGGEIPLMDMPGGSLDVMPDLVQGRTFEVLQTQQLFA